MCSEPQTDGVNTWPCGRCDACVSFDRFDWLARCMSEKVMHAHTFAVTLSYSNDTQYQRDGAAMFRYRDIQLFMASLRAQIKRDTGLVASLRFIVGGEQGERTGRVHWHIVLFSDVDLLTVGKYYAKWGQVSDRAHIVTEKGGIKKRLNWTMWPHGLVLVQEPDQWGINYAISYAMKERFQAYRSRGAKRLAKSETFGTSVFKMSKRPMLGEPYLRLRLDKMRSEGYVLPKVELRWPELKGYWRPRGRLRELLLQGMREINEEYRQTTGRDTAQWTSLVASTARPEGERNKDWEILVDEPEATQDESDLIVAEAIARARDSRAYAATKQIRYQCGSTRACTRCLHAEVARSANDPFGVEYYSAEDGTGYYRYKEQDEDGERLRQHQRDRARKAPHPCCQARGDASRRLAFPLTSAKRSADSQH